MGIVNRWTRSSGSGICQRIFFVCLFATIFLTGIRFYRNRLEDIKALWFTGSLSSPKWVDNDPGGDTLRQRSNRFCILSTCWYWL